MTNQIQRWNPFREMLEMRSAFDRMWDDSWQGMFKGGDLAIDVDENDNHYVVTAELPGVQAENVNVRFHDGMLTIDAEIPETTTERNGDSRSLIRERRYGRMTRSVRLPQVINAESAEASFENGVLTLTLPKSPEAQPKLIPIHKREQLKSGNQN